MNSLRFTLVGVFLAVLVFILNLAFDLDLFEILIGLLQRSESFELDELLLVLVVLLPFVVVDLIRYRLRLRQQKDRIQLHQAMMFAVHHTQNNFLNQMQYFRMIAEENSRFDPDVIALFDEVIRDAHEQIRALGEIETIDEDAIKTAVLPK